MLLIGVVDAVGVSDDEGDGVELCVDDAVLDVVADCDGVMLSDDEGVPPAVSDADEDAEFEGVSDAVGDTEGVTEDEGVCVLDRLAVGV